MAAQNGQCSRMYPSTAILPNRVKKWTLAPTQSRPSVTNKTIPNLSVQPSLLPRPAVGKLTAGMA